MAQNPTQLAAHVKHQRFVFGVPDGKKFRDGFQADTQATAMRNA